MLERKSLQRGMHVRSADHARIGTIFLLGETHFELRHGLLGAPHLLVPYDGIESIENGEVHLREGLAPPLEGTLADSGDATPPTTDKPISEEAQLHRPPEHETPDRAT